MEILPAPKSKPKPPRQVARPTDWPGWILAAAATLIFGVFIGWILTQPPVVQSIARSGAGDNPAAAAGDHATLVQATDVVWGRSGVRPAEGDTLSDQWVRLESGALLLEFARGARVVLEGPAEFKIVSDNEGFLEAGMLRASIPPSAHGFTVVSPDFTVVDYGTEFGCKVASKTISEVHVFSGSVDLKMPTMPGAVQRLRQSQAMRLTDGKAENIPAEPEIFYSEQRLKVVRSVLNERFAKWQTEHRALSEHPKALVHLTFEPEPDRGEALTNHAVEAVDSAAYVFGPKMVDGRWPSKGARKFERPDDRLRMEVKGSFQSMTFLAWIRLDKLPQQKASLVMSESIQPGEAHWYMTGDGRLGFDVRVGGNGQPKQFVSFLSNSVPIPLGKWVMVAAVYDGDQGTLMHYLNGEQIGFANLAKPPLLHLDAFEIGNWAVDPKKRQWEWVKLEEVPVRRPAFEGTMDELAILSSPLGPKEIQRIYEDGRPYPAGLDAK